MNTFKVMLAIAFLSGTAVALAAERTIKQKGRIFSEAEVAIKKGDTLVFLNDDNIIHNVISITPGTQFNLGSIPPGNSTPVTFTNTGNISVICAIHPSMSWSKSQTNFLQRVDIARCQYSISCSQPSAASFCSRPGLPRTVLRSFPCRIRCSYDCMTDRSWRSVMLARRSSISRRHVLALKKQ